MNRDKTISIYREPYAFIIFKVSRAPFYTFQTLNNIGNNTDGVLERNMVHFEIFHGSQYLFVIKKNNKFSASVCFSLPTMLS